MFNLISLHVGDYFLCFQMENEEVMGGTSELVDKVNLVDEDKDDDDLVKVELEDVLVIVGSQKRKAKRR